MKNKLKNYFQTQFHFSSLEADKILYGLEALVSESVKFLILLFIALSLGYADEMLVATIVLLSIRSNSGGLHFSHFFSYDGILCCCHWFSTTPIAPQTLFLRFGSGSWCLCFGWTNYFPHASASTAPRCTALF